MAYCGWGTDDPVWHDYHEHWGTPVHDDRTQFRHLTFEVMQCGLSFRMVYGKRAVLGDCFAGFDFDRVAGFGDADVARIMGTGGMIRSERKIRAVIGNSRAFQRIREKFGSFSDYIWAFSEGRSILYRGHETGLVPASNRLSEKVSKDFKARGFSFLGPVVVYSHLQACGIINDHDAACPRRQYLIEHYPTIEKRRYGEKGLRQF